MPQHERIYLLKGPGYILVSTGVSQTRKHPIEQHRGDTTIMIGKSVCLVTVLLALAGCFSVANDFSEPSNKHWSNCQCVAGNAAGSRFIGWSVKLRRARHSALTKCRTHSANPHTCRISSCESTS